MKDFRAGFSVIEIIIFVVFVFNLAMSMIGHSRENPGATGAIINNLRILKTAALVFHEQSPDVRADIEKIISTAGGGSFDGYNFVENDAGSFVMFGKGDAKNSVEIHDVVKKKLTARANSVGLMGSENNLTAPTEIYSAHEAVGLRVR